MKKSHELIRIQNIIENDRLSFGNGFNDLFKSDLLKFITDYFTISTSPLIKIEKSKEGICVDISFNATGIKHFNSIK